MRIDIQVRLVNLRLFMATILTSLATAGSTAANTACEPTLGKVDAYIKNSKALTYCVPNEYICAEIGRFLGLPIPPSGLVYKAGNDPEHFFASLNFNLCNSQLPPINPDTLVNTFGSFAVGIILFDMLIANNDRHRKNLSLDTSADPPRLTVFDHSHSLFGIQNGQGRARLYVNKDEFCIGGHCLLASITTDAHFSEWFGRVKGLPDYLIDNACDATVPLGMISAAEAAAAKDFLKHRRDRIDELIRSNRQKFTSVSEWSLML